MCMSFTDLPLARQEEVWVNTTRFATDLNDRYQPMWASRADAQGRVVAEAYAALSADDLKTHRTMLTTEHGHDTTWAHVIAAADAEHVARMAVADVIVVDEPGRWVLAGAA